MEIGEGHSCGVGTPFPKRCSASHATSGKDVVGCAWQRQGNTLEIELERVRIDVVGRHHCADQFGPSWHRLLANGFIVFLSCPTAINGIVNSRQRLGRPAAGHRCTWSLSYDDRRGAKDARRDGAPVTSW
jgi:hypothetical protein